MSNLKLRVRLLLANPYINDVPDAQRGLEMLRNALEQEPLSVPSASTDLLLTSVERALWSVVESSDEAEDA
jgi:hypothetical protein